MKDNPISEPALVISVISEATVLTVPPGLISSSSQVIIIIIFLNPRYLFPREA